LAQVLTEWNQLSSRVCGHVTLFAFPSRWRKSVIEIYGAENSSGFESLSKLATLRALLFSDVDVGLI